MMSKSMDKWYVVLSDKMISEQAMDEQMDDEWQTVNDRLRNTKWSWTTSDKSQMNDE